LLESLEKRLLPVAKSIADRWAVFRFWSAGGRFLPPVLQDREIAGMTQRQSKILYY